MDLRTCEYCGIEYDASLTQCPLCGRNADVAAVPVSGRTAQKKKKGGARLAKNTKQKPSAAPAAPDAADDGNPYAIPKWMMVTICVILGVAVILGAAFAIYNLDWFGLKKSDSAQQSQTAGETSAALPEAPADTTPSEEQYMNEEDYTAEPQPEKPAVVECTGLTLGASSITFDEAEQFYNITATVEPADCTQEVVYTSADESIATINAQGKIVAINGGSTTITVSCGTQSATCLVTCDFSFTEVPGAEETLPPELNNTDMTFFSPGEQFTLVVLNLPEGQEVTFASNDPQIASVSSTGVVTAMGSGTTTVTATAAGQSFSCIVRCNLDSSAESGSGEPTCTISHSDVTMSIVGEYFRLSLKDADGNKVSGLVWTSSDNSVCSVDSDGVVTAVGRGTAYVSTTFQGVSYECIVRCNMG